ncbi:hypothetical protein Asulf_01114 [Archaeoglobus sulfaticallidus PM70-1]|uniref:Uncharacterized protein n=1 Tax=Archaeoglobus sulfaticallidus PM70-1 TaxID=387631 RepID=N0BBX3_9EURY|nr:hypothetical protein [Archaeoglobus sulfaticallidus]AGK61114.1 hypothetical protein Asulf_01114 [Archaeoglobus sulfaticallidus PM70-1]
MDPPSEFLEFIYDEELPFMLKVYDELNKLNSDLPVLYAGSAGDIEHAIFLGKNLVFFDNHLPEESVREIINKISRIGKIESKEMMGELKKGGKFIMKFKIADQSFHLTFYGEDATTVGITSYPELENGISVYFVKVPYPREGNTQSIRYPAHFARALKLIEVGGYYLEKECPLAFKLDIEKLGFRKIAEGEIYALSIKWGEKGNLYKKVRDVADIEKLLIEDYIAAGFDM